MEQATQQQPPEQAPAPRTAAAAVAEAHQYLTFSLGGEIFGMDIRNVKEIIEYGSLTKVPMMPAFIRGVINLRGGVVPVIDLALRFRGSSTEIGRRTCIVIVELADKFENRQYMGVLVDSVNEVLEIPARDIEPPPPFGAKINTDFIDGMGKVAGKFVILLAVQQVLSDGEVAQFASAAAQAGAAPVAIH